MARALKVIGTIAGVVAMFVPGLQAIGAISMLSKGGTIAGMVAAAAGVGASLIGTKPPPARGSVTQSAIAVDSPQPYVMGEGYVAGIVRHIAGYGATLKKVPNPYRGEVHVYSGAGPVQSITPYVDQATIDAWYTGYLYTDTQLGACPEASALAPNYAGMTGWDSTSKLSGQAAILWNMLFDKDGKRFASGVPQLGAYGQWVKVYDPRLDSTRDGGSGSHRVTDETTWAWSDNPALHAATYTYGRYQNGKLVLGVGMPDDGIDWDSVIAWANVCDANAWTIFGRIFEPGDRWQNLRDICMAGGGEPVFSRGVMGFRYAAPQTSLDTITQADVVGDMSVTAMASWRERINTIVPRCIQATHNWELVQLDPVTVSAYVTEDGEIKQAEWPFNLVKDKDQAAQLAAYRLTDARELQPIELTVGPRLRAYRPGECLTLDLPEIGLATDAVILTREFDPATMTIKLVMIGETAAKHAYALGETGTAPPTPSLAQSGEDRDLIRDAVTGMSNFEARNDRDDTAVVTPAIPGAGAAIDHAINTDSTADISFEWTWGGTEVDIDGFVVYVRSSTSSSAYTFGTSPDQEATYVMRADKRAIILRGQPANLYYTFGVRAYRVVDPDIDATGVMQSSIVQSAVAGENPYRPSSSVAFAGDVSGTVNGLAATDVSSTINSGGGVANNQVATGALQANSATLNGSFWIDYSGATIGSATTWVQVTNGFTDAEVSIATGPLASQQVIIDAVVGVRRAGGANDNLQFKIKRASDSTYLTQVYAMETTNDKMIQPLKFLDPDPPNNTTETYELWWYSDDSGSPIYEVFLHTLLTKTG